MRELVNTHDSDLGFQKREDELDEWIRPVELQTVDHAYGVNGLLDFHFSEISS